MFFVFLRIPLPVLALLGISSESAGPLVRPCNHSTHWLRSLCCRVFGGPWLQACGARGVWWLAGLLPRVLLNSFWGCLALLRCLLGALMCLVRIEVMVEGTVPQLVTKRRGV